MAQDWGAQWLNLGQAGHINAESSLGDWPQGHALLQTLLKD
jgi:predicted alpha/beta hydrolase family esterase